MNIFWFRRDLRLADNPGLSEAILSGQVLPIYIVDNTTPHEFEMGSASRTWLHYSLLSLHTSLREHLNVYRGDPVKIIRELVARFQIENVFWSDSFEPWEIEQEHKIKTLLQQLNVSYKSFNSCYLWSPNDILKDDGTYYKVFTAYKRKAHQFPYRIPLHQPKRLNVILDDKNTTKITDLNLLSNNDWHENMMSYWKVGENAAEQALSEFIQEYLRGYKNGRDYPGQRHTSRLSPHLHFGEISPHQILHAIRVNEQDSDHFFSEITWREFSNYLLYHFPKLYTDNFKSQFNEFPWGNNKSWLECWQNGLTGYPIIDAGMRELWQTGYMHNRVRMIVASFLVKNLMIHWHHGRDWFWDCLVDADLANNSASWQWVAGSGVDAAPYFRIFNPVTQGEKFDANGAYTRQFVPELKHLPDQYLFKPWEAPENLLKNAGIELGVTYPNPIVDLKTSRELALNAYHILKS